MIFALKKISFFIVISFFGGYALSATKNTPIDFQKIEQDIELGRLSKAENSLLQLEKSKKISKNQKYHALKLLSKIYLIEQNFTKYSSHVEKAIDAAKKLHPIYQSEAYAYKSYYYHYLMWGDSALLYSNKSMELLQNNRSHFSKIEPAFVYEVYAITYLYRPVTVKASVYRNLDISESERKRFQYFDSSLFIQKKYPFKFTSDKAMFYRSYGNRWLDLVSSYRICTKEETTHFRKVQWIAHHRANALYDLGLACLKPCHKNDFISLISLKAMNFTNVAKFQEAEQLFESVHKRFSHKMLLDRTQIAYQTLMNFETFKVRNIIFSTYNNDKVNKEISFLHSLKRDFWNSFFQECELPYDPYRTSPYINLFSLYAFKSKNGVNKKENLSKAVSYLLTMKSYFHYLKGPIAATKNHLPYLSVKHIQRQLKKDECYLFAQNDADFLAHKKLLITPNNILFVNSKRETILTNNSTDFLSLSSFKRNSYQDYLSNFQDIQKHLPSVKKVFISYDDKVPYEILISDTMGKSYRVLNYLGSRINFVRIYNPYSYFQDTLIAKSNNIDVREVYQQNTSKLLFMKNFFKNFNPESDFTYSRYTGNLKSLLNQRGILHFFGHGELVRNESTNSQSFQITYEANNSKRYMNKLSGEFEVRRDLVVMNNCFSGYSDILINEFNKTIPLRILSNGANAVISSPSVVDDFYSAQFFTLFYAKLESGMLYEDAFFEAKRTFFLTNPELRNPQIWNGLQLISNRKMKNTPVTNYANYSLLFVIVVFLDSALTLLNYRWHNYKPPHPAN